MGQRIQQELELLRSRWPGLEYLDDGQWVLLPRYSLPATCVQETSDVAFQIKPGHPGDAPYGFYVKRPIELETGKNFENTSSGSEVPFDGDWLNFSWSPADWRPATEPRNGSNLLNWALTFRERLAEGE